MSIWVRQSSKLDKPRLKDTPLCASRYNAYEIKPSARQ